MVGTYLHGPLLPRNPWFADWILAEAAAHQLGEPPDLEPLNDELELQAHGVSADARPLPRRPLLALELGDVLVAQLDL